MSNRDVMQQALEALEFDGFTLEDETHRLLHTKAITALRKALEQQAEPVAWAVQGTTQMFRGEFAELDAKSKARRIGGTCVAYPLYTAPPQRKELSASEILNMMPSTIPAEYDGPLMDFARAIEAKLKEKNGY